MVRDPEPRLLLGRTKLGATSRSRSENRPARNECQTGRGSYIRAQKETLALQPVADDRSDNSVYAQLVSADLVLLGEDDVLCGHSLLLVLAAAFQSCAQLRNLDILALVLGPQSGDGRVLLAAFLAQDANHVEGDQPRL